ncbi:AraC family transcriptional regulator [Chitinolyticbacter meiyuanensis]|uniref:AraC family transcriptional regulator n=1 Tax=Chitinolyticbacter meiyuanensis TaxID=682798 RepID=UPI0011E5E00C|nr:AraC family transcriptional regulator [Chitinolyticbacter meiyuanensis]
MHVPDTSRYRQLASLGIEVASLRFDGVPIPKHTHDEFVIAANLGGIERVWLDGKRFDARDGDITVYNPGALQASDGGSGAWGCASLYLAPSRLMPLLGRSEHHEFVQPLLRNTALATQLIAAVGAALDAETAADAAEADEALLSVLDALFSGHAEAVTRAVPNGGDVLLLRAEAQLLEQMMDQPDLASLADQLGLSAVQLVRAFNRRHGLPPLAWLRQQRLRAAKQGLLHGEVIADVAARLGFADQAHLTRQFRAQFGLTPAQVRSRRH